MRQTMVEDMNMLSDLTTDRAKMVLLHAYLGLVRARATFKAFFWAKPLISLTFSFPV
jgi:hypothetical protein